MARRRASVQGLSQNRAEKLGINAHGCCIERTQGPGFTAAFRMRCHTHDCEWQGRGIWSRCPACAGIAMVRPGEDTSDERTRTR